MDPISIIGVIGSVVGIVDVVTKSIRKLSEIKSRYRNAPFQISTLIGQLYIIQAALNQLAEWKARDLSRQPRYAELATQIDNSLECFCPLLLALEDQLESLDLSSPDNMKSMSRLSFIWNERELSQYLDLIDRQVNALNLFLQAIQCRSWTEQKTVVSEADNQTILRLAKDCNSSMLGLDDEVSTYKDNADAVSIEFDFDAILLGSRAYQAAQRSNLKSAINAKRQGTRQPESDQDHLDDKSTSAHPFYDFPVNIMNEDDISLPAYLANDFSGLDFDFGKQSGNSKSDSGQSKQSISSSGKLPLQATPNTLPHTAIENRSSGTLQILGMGNSQQPKARIKVLILGSSESGKSTLLKRLKLHFSGYTMEERLAFREIIISNVVQSTRVVIESTKSLDISLAEHANEQYANIILQQPPVLKHFPSGVEDAVRNLWTDTGFLTAYKRRFEYQLTDSAQEFAEDISRIAREDWIPTDQDILMARVKTTGITSLVLDVITTGKGTSEQSTTTQTTTTTLEVCDVGGVRSQRKNWIHAFHKTGVIVFCIDAIAYARLLFEDESVNRMQEQITLFESIVNSKWFPSTEFVLVFTKMDKLTESMTIVPIVERWSEFTPSLSSREEHENHSHSHSHGHDHDHNDIETQYRLFLARSFINLAKSHERRRRIRVTYADLAHTDQTHDPLDKVMHLIMTGMTTTTTTTSTPQN